MTDRFARLASEFPLFDVATLPDIPAHWQDNSWHNDACPYFQISPRVGLFIDYANPALREFASDTVGRFILMRLDDGMIADRESLIYVGDDWQKVLAEALAWEFRQTLRDELDDRQWQQMLTTNVGVAEGICASHDVCDANMPMAEAFEAIVGHEPMTIEVDGERRFCSDFDTAEANAAQEKDCALWSSAWAIATPRYLTAD